MRPYLVAAAIAAAITIGTTVVVSRREMSPGRALAITWTSRAVVLGICAFVLIVNLAHPCPCLKVTN